MKIQGADVEDATEGLVVAITKTDVKLGSTKKARSCAAARALCRQEHCEEARVHFSRAYIKKDGKWRRYAVPPSLRNEIIAFDRGGEFVPGEYRLQPIQPSIRLDAPAGRWKKYAKANRKISQCGNRPKRVYHVVSGVRERMMADWE